MNMKKFELLFLEYLLLLILFVLTTCLSYQLDLQDDFEQKQKENRNEKSEN